MTTGASGGLPWEKPPTNNSNRSGENHIGNLVKEALPKAIPTGNGAKTIGKSNTSSGETKTVVIPAIDGRGVVVTGNDRDIEREMRRVEDARQLIAAMKAGSQSKNRKAEEGKAREKLLAKDQPFILLPMRMLTLRSSGLTANEVLLLAALGGFQRKDPDASYRASRSTLATLMGWQANHTSTRIAKLRKAELVEVSGHGTEKSYRVNERRWAELVGARIDLKDNNAVHEWTLAGEFARIPLWVSSRGDLSSNDKIIFGFVFSSYARKNEGPYKRSLYNTAEDLGSSTNSVLNSFKKLVDLKFLTKKDVAPRVPAEYRIDPLICDNLRQEYEKTHH